MLVLALDSAMNGCGVGLHDFTADIHISKTLEISRGQAEALIPMVNDALKDAKKTYDDIEMIAVTHGPGAFTGLRVAMATAKSLGLALNIPVVGICTFEAVLNTYINEQKPKDLNKVAVVLETKRRDFYLCCFDADQRPITEKVALGAFDAVEFIKGVDAVIGDAVQRLSEEIDVHNCMTEKVMIPNTKYIAKLSTLKNSVACEPVYIRPPDAIIPQNLRRIKSE